MGASDKRSSLFLAEFKRLLKDHGVCSDEEAVEEKSAVFVGKDCGVTRDEKMVLFGVQAGLDEVEPREREE